MLLDYIDKKIRKAFSGAALEYDLLTSLHKEIGRELHKKVLNASHTDAILDIGMGTGWLTKKIQFYFPDSNIVGIDFAEGMLREAAENATEIKLIQANAMRMPFKSASFDLIVSNLSLQWVRSLEICFSDVHKSLKKEGEVVFTLFGHNTFKELFNSLENANKDTQLNIKRLHSMEQVKSALELSNFKNIELDHELIKVNFTDMYRLIKWIKDIGANELDKQMFIGKDLLAAANEHYENNYKDKFGIYATFEVIWVAAQK